MISKSDVVVRSFQNPNLQKNFDRLTKPATEETQKSLDFGDRSDISSLDSNSVDGNASVVFPKAVAQVVAKSYSDNSSNIPVPDFETFKENLADSLGELATVKDNVTSGIPGEIPTVSQMNETFAECVNDKEIPWKYILDGCYSRAHIACKKFIDKGYNAGKMFMMVDLKERPRRFLQAKNQIMQAVWWYHVGTLTFARDEETGKVEGYVIDPAINKDRPLKADEWIKSCWSQKNHLDVSITQAQIPYPEEIKDEPFSLEKFNGKIDEFEIANKEYTKAYEKELDLYRHRYPRRNLADSEVVL